MRLRHSKLVSSNKIEEIQEVSDYPLVLDNMANSEGRKEGRSLLKLISILLVVLVLMISISNARSGKSSHGVNTNTFGQLSEFISGQGLKQALLYDDVLLKARERQFRNKNVVVFKALKLTKPKIDRLFNYALTTLNSKTYHFAVLFDNTQGLAQSKLVERDPRFHAIDRKRFHMYNYTLFDVIAEFPELIQYLYREEFRDDHSNVVRGSCCLREELWQVLRAPLILWQNKKDLRFQYTWMIEDDFEALKDGESVLIDFLRDLDTQYTNVDVLAFRQTPCPTIWHKIRQTYKFKQLVSRIQKKRLPWLCLADYAQRLSRDYLRAHERALHNFVFAFGETMVYPVAINAGLVVKLYWEFEWLGYLKRPFIFYYNKSLADPDSVYFAHIKE